MGGRLRNRVFKMIPLKMGPLKSRLWEVEKGRNMMALAAHFASVCIYLVSSTESGKKSDILLKGKVTQDSAMSRIISKK